LKKENKNTKSKELEGKIEKKGFVHMATKKVRNAESFS
jgi:hypothetical protein